MPNDTATQQKPQPTKPAQKPQAPNKQQAPGPLETVIIRNQFYQDRYRTLVRIALVEAIAIVVLVVGLVFAVNMQTVQNVYFATTSDGKIIQLQPLNRPNMSDSTIINWASQAATDIMTFGFHDYRKRLQDSSEYFTDRGWESFTNALKESRVIDAVKARQQVITATLNGAPIVIEEGLVNNLYRWVIEIPMLITYQSGSSIRPDSVLLRLVIVRVSTLDNPSGVGIEQWIARNK